MNLRKANAIQQEIRNATRAIDAPLSIKITEFENSEAAIRDAHEAAMKARKKWDGLNKALFEIRAKVGAKNAECGINETLADVAELDSRVAMLRSIVGPTAIRLDPEVLAGKMSKLKTPAPDGGMRPYRGTPDDTVTTGIFTKDEILVMEKEIAALRREKRDLQDALLGKNASYEIQLSSDSEAVLVEAGIV